MYTPFFYLLFLMCIGIFTASFLFREPDNKLLFSVFSVILFAALALASFGIEVLSVVVVGTEVVEHTAVIYSPSFAYICVAFAIISLISSVVSALSYMSNLKLAGVDNDKFT